MLDTFSPLATVRWTIPKYPSKFDEIRNQIRSLGDGLLVSACREVQVEHLSAAIDVEIVVYRLSVSLGREKSLLYAGQFTVYHCDAVFANYAVSEPYDFAIGRPGAVSPAASEESLGICDPRGLKMAYQTTIVPFLSFS